MNGDIDVTKTLLEQNLKFMADITLMRETLTHLVENSMDSVPGYGRFSLTVNQVNFEIESLLNSKDSIVGACEVISLPGGTDNDATIPQVGWDRLTSCSEMMSIVEACVLNPVQEVRVFEDKLATAFASNSDCKSIQFVHFKSPKEGNKVVSDAAGIIVYAA